MALLFQSERALWMKLSLRFVEDGLVRTGVAWGTGPTAESSAGVDAIHSGEARPILAGHHPAALASSVTCEINVVEMRRYEINYEKEGL